MTEKFGNLTAGATPVLVYVTAMWCGPCQTMKPIVQQFKQAEGERVRVVLVDVDRNQALASQLGIQGVPALMLFRHGQQVWRASGVQPLGVLQAALNKSYENA